MINKKILLVLINITNILSVKYETIVNHNIYINYISNTNTKNTRNNFAILFVKSPSKNNNNKQRRSIRNSTRKKHQSYSYIDTISKHKLNRSEYSITFF